MLEVSKCGFRLSVEFLCICAHNEMPIENVVNNLTSLRGGIGGFYR